MDAVSDIKARLPIEELVGKYCQLQRKGRSFVALCPFHQDSHPSLLVSPDKGIAYCFACQKGGDIFSFYQEIEGVDFRQAVKDLAERTGVALPDMKEAQGPTKDEKTRLRSCLDAALQFYRDQLRQKPEAQAYIQKRGIPASQVEQFQLGYAPSSFTATYDHLLKKGFSRGEIINAGMGVQRDLADQRVIDRFRNRLMFPIHDSNGALIGFGGRTLGDDDAKYVNSAESPLYHKSNVLYGLHHAKEAMREQKAVLIVEGYMDLLACHRIGVTNVVASSGTALTEQQAKILHRTCDTAVLCLDSDRAGRDAAERAFFILSKEGMQVQRLDIPGKDPDEAAASDATALKELLNAHGKPYVDAVLEDLRKNDVSSPLVRRQSLERLLHILEALPFAVEREEYLRKAATIFGATYSALAEDLQKYAASARAPLPTAARIEHLPQAPFSKIEVTLCLFLFYPECLTFLAELIPPEEGFAAALYQALREVTPGSTMQLDQLTLTPDQQERVRILYLYGEECGFGDWSQSLAEREVRKHCRMANHDVLQRKLQDISRKLQQARIENAKEDLSLLEIQYEQILKLSRMAH